MWMNMSYLVLYQTYYKPEVAVPEMHILLWEQWGLCSYSLLSDVSDNMSLNIPNNNTDKFNNRPFPKHFTWFIVLGRGWIWMELGMMTKIILVPSPIQKVCPLKVTKNMLNFLQLHFIFDLKFSITYLSHLTHIQNHPSVLI